MQSIQRRVNRANVNLTDSNGRTALFAASEGGKVDAIGALVELGADVNRPDSNGRTALFAASANGKIHAISALVELGAGVNHPDRRGRTPLFAASRENQTGSIKALAELGADVNKEDDEKKTPLLVSIKLELKDAIKALKHHGAMGRGTSADTFRTKEIFETKRLQLSISLDDYWKAITRDKTDKKTPRDISLSSFYDDGNARMIVAFEDGFVGSVYRDIDGKFPCFSSLEADNLQSAGRGKVIYTRAGKVYENSIDLQEETGPLKTIPHSTRLGCFAGNGDKFFIVKSVVPLRILKVAKGSCSEIKAAEKGHASYPTTAVVKKDYPNLGAIEHMLVDENRTGESIFGVATAGVRFGGEHLFVGHAKVTQQGDCFPNALVGSLSKDQGEEMHYMYFYTIGFDSGMFRLSRVTSCFHPPPSSEETFHKKTVPTGLSRYGRQLLVSFGRDTQKSWVTSYPETEIRAMLAPVSSWNDNNYVFHPSYAESLRTARNASRSTWHNLIRTDRAGLIGTSLEHGGRFNPAIANFDAHDGTFVTAWRKLNGSVEDWIGYNQVAMETCSLKIEGGKLVYTRESEVAEFQVGTTTAGGEDPRLITENGCPLIFVNDLNKSGSRRIYVHNLLTDNSVMTVHPFCNNLDRLGKEKNWGPFYHNGLLHFVYGLNPLKVGMVADTFRCPSAPGQTAQECKWVDTAGTPANIGRIISTFHLAFRGGTPGLPYREHEYLFVGHSVIHTKAKDCFTDFVVERMMGKTTEATAHQKKYRKMYMTFFYTIGKKASGGGENNVWEMKRLSCCSHLPGKNQNFSKIQFPAGLAKANLGREFGDAFVVSFGDEDRYGGFCAVNREFLNAVLRPVADWNVGNYVLDINYFQNVLNVTN